jgi:DNA-binding MarR family transcriptional regulator
MAAKHRWAVLRGAERLSQKLPRYLTSELERLRLTDLEAHVLLFLSKDDRSVADLQKALGAAPSTLTGVIDRLERSSLVKRIVNPADRRSFLIHALEPGRNAAMRVSATFDRFESRVLDHGGLASDDVAAFLRVVGAIDEVIG